MSIEGISTLAERSPKLTEFSANAMSGDQIAAMSRHYPRLTFISDLGGQDGDDASSTSVNEGLVAMGFNCHELETVNLLFAADVWNTGVIALAKGCPKLKRVIFGLADITDAAVVAIAKNCHQLELFRRGDGDVDLFYVTDLSLFALAQHCPHLSEIYMHRCAVTDVGVAALATSLRQQITGVTFSNCDELTDDSAVALSMNCSRLRDVDLSHNGKLTDAGVMALAVRCDELTTATFRDCPQLTDASAVALAGYMGQRPHARVD